LHLSVTGLVAVVLSGGAPAASPDERDEPADQRPAEEDVEQEHPGRAVRLLTRGRDECRQRVEPDANDDKRFRTNCHASPSAAALGSSQSCGER